MSARVAGAIAGACIVLAVVFAHDTLLLVFAGALVAIALRGAAEWIAERIRVPVVWCVWLTAVLLLLAFFGASALMGNALAAQMTELQRTLPDAIHRAVVQAGSTGAGAWISANMPALRALVPDTAQLLLRVSGMLSGALGALIAILIIVFVGIAGAVEPQMYVNGVVQLFPAEYRPRLRAVSGELAKTLRTWMFARIVSMAITGTLVAVGLTVLRVPLAGALGVLAGALAFIPNVGAIVAAAPAILLAFASSPQLALAVLVMYWGVHVVDDFVVAPVLERQVVKLPPILTLAAQVILSIGAGAIGTILAAPLVAAAIVLVRRLWVEDVVDQMQTIKRNTQSATASANAVRDHIETPVEVPARSMKT